MNSFIKVNGKCPFCNEPIELEVLTNEKTPIECPECNVLMDVENGKLSVSTYKPKIRTKEEVIALIDAYKEILLLHDPLKELIDKENCAKILEWYNLAEKTEELKVWTEKVFKPKLAENDMFECLSMY